MGSGMTKTQEAVHNAIAATEDRLRTDPMFLAQCLAGVNGERELRIIAVDSRGKSQDIRHMRLTYFGVSGVLVMEVAETKEGFNIAGVKNSQIIDIGFDVPKLRYTVLGTTRRGDTGQQYPVQAVYDAIDGDDAARQFRSQYGTPLAVKEGEYKFDMLNQPDPAHVPDAPDPDSLRI
jgi:hypothetical protein